MNKIVVTTLLTALLAWGASAVTTIRAHEGGVCAMALNPQATLLATAGEEKSVKIWELPSLTLVATLKNHEKKSCQLAFDAEGKTLFSGGDDGKVMAYRIVSKESRQIAAMATPIFSMAYDVQRHRLAVGTGQGVTMIDPETLAKGSVMMFGTQPLALAISRQTNRLAVGGSDHHIHLVDLQTQSPVNLLSRHKFAVWALLADRDISRLYSAGEDRQTLAWSVAADAKEPLFAFEGAGATLILAQSRSGRVIAGGGMDGVIRLWHSTDGKKREQFQAHDQAVRGVVFVGAQGWLISGGDEGDLKVWSVKD